jgi:arginine-tRNA-protein transferase
VDSRLAQRPFYSTELAPCPYLEGRQERRIVAILAPDAAAEQFDELTEAGFRRSHRYLYRPLCPGCNACVPVRIVVDRFHWSRTFKKLLGRNADLEVRERPATATTEQYELFHRYLQARHDDGGMVKMDRADYTEMVERGVPGSRLIEARDAHGRLVGVSLTDRLRSGFSGVYKFYEPEEPRRSLGTFLILWHVVRARELGLPYVYLGYWIAQSPKMAYKARFRPLERLDALEWRPLAEDGVGQPGGE